NKRIIIEDDKTLLDSKPLNTVEEGSLIRYISKIPKISLYTKNMSNSISGKYKNVLDLAIRNFIRALLNNELNLNNDLFKSYKEIVNYIKCYDTTISINEHKISLLKRRGNFCKVPKRPESVSFVEYVKIRFPNFNDEGFFTS